jgi:putative intracellular protease/amidase
MKKVLIPLPSYGFDPSEAAIPWKVLTENKIEVAFATPQGQKAAADIRMLRGDNLGIWKSLLMARKDAVAAYKEMEKTEAFNHPVSYISAKEGDYDALLLPGGHDKGVREYLESGFLQKLVVSFFHTKKPVAAICHGVLLAARSIDPLINKSVIYDYKTTSLLKSQEMAAYNLTRLWLKDYYLTYPDITVEDEVRASLSDENNFVSGPTPISRDDRTHLDRGFTVLDRNYLSARWPGDAYSFALALAGMLKE